MGNDKARMLDFLRDLASKTIDKCTFPKDVTYFGEARRHDMLLPSGALPYAAMRRIVRVKNEFLIL